MALRCVSQTLFRLGKEPGLQVSDLINFVPQVTVICRCNRSTFDDIDRLQTVDQSGLPRPWRYAMTVAVHNLLHHSRALAASAGAHYAESLGLSDSTPSLPPSCRTLSNTVELFIAAHNLLAVSRPVLP